MVCGYVWFEGGFVVSKVMIYVFDMVYGMLVVGILVMLCDVVGVMLV